MFYIDIWEGQVADWIPLWGGQYIALWPIFNIADASIFCGVTLILIMQKKFFVEHEKETKVAEAVNEMGESKATQLPDESKSID
jgi:signal peptidase II